MLFYWLVTVWVEEGGGGLPRTLYSPQGKICEKYFDIFLVFLSQTWVQETWHFPILSWWYFWNIQINSNMGGQKVLWVKLWWSTTEGELTQSQSTASSSQQRSLINCIHIKSEWRELEIAFNSVCHPPNSRPWQTRASKDQKCGQDFQIFKFIQIEKARLLPVNKFTQMREKISANVLKFLSFF